LFYEFYGDNTKLFSIADTGVVKIWAGDLYFENGEFISNSTDGTLTCNGHVTTTGSFNLNQAQKISFDSDADSHTYILESANDILDIYVGGDKALSIVLRVVRFLLLTIR